MDSENAHSFHEFSPIIGTTSGESSVHDALKTGNWELVKQYVETYGPQCLYETDCDGYSAAHWVCLSGDREALQYLLDHGAPLNQPALEQPSACPIHWASANGHIGAVDLLLNQGGVSLHLADGKGYTPLITACQHGHLLLALYLIGKGADIHVMDADGDNSLHWAAFKGHTDLIRILMNMGLPCNQADKHGQTPLHLACINGSLKTVRLICDQDGVNMEIADNNGATPTSLAAGRKHLKVEMFIQKLIRHKKSLKRRLDFRPLLFGVQENTNKPMLFYMFFCILWAYPIYLLKVLWDTWPEEWILHVILWAMIVITWTSLYIANSKDPGNVPRNIPEYNSAIKQVVYYDRWKHETNPISNLCHTCKTVKPIRSKHCRVCNRCVMQFDHHCPWIYNCVGYHNRMWFFLFVVGTSIQADIAIYFMYGMIYREGFTHVLKASTPFAFICLLFSNYLVCTTIYNMTKNLTINEFMNWSRYNYMKDINGNFTNPFDRGAKRNVKEYLHLLPSSQVESLESIKTL